MVIISLLLSCVYTTYSPEVLCKSYVETEKYRKYIGRMCLYQPHGTASYRFVKWKLSSSSSYCCGLLYPTAAATILFLEGNIFERGLLPHRRQVNVYRMKKMYLSVTTMIMSIKRKYFDSKCIIHSVEFNLLYSTQTF